MVTHTIEELHELFKSGELDVKEYYKELFEEAKKQQERLNAFVTITEDEAYKAIEAPMTDDLLSHIPYVLKDNYNTKGIKTTASSKMLADYVPVFNAHVVDLLNKHGVGLVGKASMDELAMGGTNKSALTGPVHNPWDTRRISVVHQEDLQHLLQVVLSHLHLVVIQVTQLENQQVFVEL